MRYENLKLTTAIGYFVRVVSRSWSYIFLLSVLFIDIESNALVTHIMSVNQCHRL